MDDSEEDLYDAPVARRAEAKVEPQVSNSPDAVIKWSPGPFDELIEHLHVADKKASASTPGTPDVDDHPDADSATRQAIEARDSSTPQTTANSVGDDEWDSWPSFQRRKKKQRKRTGGRAVNVQHQGLVKDEHIISGDDLTKPNNGGELDAQQRSMPQTSIALGTNLLEETGGPSKKQISDNGSVNNAYNGVSKPIIIQKANGYEVLSADAAGDLRHKIQGDVNDEQAPQQKSSTTRSAKKVTIESEEEPELIPNYNYTSSTESINSALDFVSKPVHIRRSRSLYSSEDEDLWSNSSEENFTLRPEDSSSRAPGAKPVPYPPQRSSHSFGSDSGEFRPDAKYRGFIFTASRRNNFKLMDERSWREVKRLQMHFTGHDLFKEAQNRLHRKTPLRQYLDLPNDFIREKIDLEVHNLNESSKNAFAQGLEWSLICVDMEGNKLIVILRGLPASGFPTDPYAGYSLPSWNRYYQPDPLINYRPYVPPPPLIPTRPPNFHRRFDPYDSLDDEYDPTMPLPFRRADTAFDDDYPLSTQPREDSSYAAYRPTSTISHRYPVSVANQQSSGSGAYNGLRREETHVVPADLAIRGSSDLRKTSLGPSTSTRVQEIPPRGYQRQESNAAAVKSFAATQAGIAAEIVRKKAEESAAKVAVASAKQAAEEAPGATRDQAIKFKDCLSRKFIFPWQIARKWKGMSELINAAFLNVDVIGAQVIDGHYDLLGPDGEIILPSIWDAMIQPGFSISMHLWPLVDSKLPLPPLPSLPPLPPQRVGTFNEPGVPMLLPKSKKSSGKGKTPAGIPLPPPPPPPPLLPLNIKSDPNLRTEILPYQPVESIADFLQAGSGAKNADAAPASKPPGPVRTDSNKLPNLTSRYAQTPALPSRPRPSRTVHQDFSSYLEMVTQLSRHMPHLTACLRGAGCRNPNAGSLSCWDTLHMGGSPVCTRRLGHPDFRPGSTAVASLGTIADPRIKLRTLVVEDLTPELIESLGSTFWLNPEFFEEHLSQSGYRGSDPEGISPKDWNTNTTPKDYISLKWHRPVYRNWLKPHSSTERSALLDLRDGLVEWSGVTIVEEGDSIYSEESETVEHAILIKSNIFRSCWPIHTDPDSLVPAVSGSIAAVWEERATIYQIRSEGSCPIVIILLDPLPQMQHLREEESAREPLITTALPYAQAYNRNSIGPCARHAGVFGRRKLARKKVADLGEQLGATNSTLDDSLMWLLEATRLTPDSPDLTIQTALLWVIHRDIIGFLHFVAKALEEIGVGSTDDFLMQSRLVHWRGLISRFQVELPEMRRSFESFAALLKDGQASDIINEFVPPTLTEIDALIEQNEKSYAALRADMAVLESKRGIAEAESVSKITELAFIFIPLTFISGVFSMQIEELQTPAPVYAFVIAALLAVGLSYAIRLVVRSDSVIKWRRNQMEKIRRDQNLVPGSSIPTRTFLWYFVPHMFFSHFNKLLLAALFICALAIFPVWSRGSLNSGFKGAMTGLTVLIVAIVLAYVRFRHGSGRAFSRGIGRVKRPKHVRRLSPFNSPPPSTNRSASSLGAADPAGPSTPMSETRRSRPRPPSSRSTATATTVTLPDPPTRARQMAGRVSVSLMQRLAPILGFRKRWNKNRRATPSTISLAASDSFATEEGMSANVHELEVMPNKQQRETASGEQDNQRRRDDEEEEEVDGAPQATTNSTP